MNSALAMRLLFGLLSLVVLCVLTSGTSFAAALEAVHVAMSARSPAATGPRKALRHGASVLVTGGAGFVGYHLSMRLHLDGVRVVAIDNFDPYYSTALKRARAARLQQAGIELIEMDMCDDARLFELLQRPPGFTHVASMAAQAGVRYSLVRPQAYSRANVQCFLSVLEALRQLEYPPPLVYASSSSVYGANTKTPFAETVISQSPWICSLQLIFCALTCLHSSFMLQDRTDVPNSLYAATKKADEQFAHVYHGLFGLRVTGLRFFTVYGPWGRPDMAYFSFAHRIATGRSIQVYGHGKPQRDFTYIDDVVDGIVGALVLGAEEEVFNLGNHRTETLGRFISVLERELGRTANKTMVGMAPGDVLATYADVQHAAEKIGYEPHTSIDEGLHNFVQWYRSSDFKDEYAEVGEWTLPMPGRQPRASTYHAQARPIMLQVKGNGSLARTTTASAT